MSVEDLEREELDDETTVEEGDPRHTVGMEGSLRDRMQARAKELETQATERFPVPGYADLLQLELRSLGWDTVRKITDRHARRRDASLRDLYLAADTLLAATVCFHEVDGQPLGSSWLELARNVRPNLPENATARQAVLSLLRADRTTAVIDLWNEWAEWNNAERTTLGEELGEDFTTTR
jgi:hypothetical protein